MVELRIAITNGLSTNQSLTFKVWGPGKTRRSKSLKRGQSLRIHVIQHQLENGRRFNRVIDFHAAASMTVIEAMSHGNSPTGETSRLDIATEEQAEIPAVLWRRLTDYSTQPSAGTLANKSRALRQQLSW